MLVAKNKIINGVTSMFKMNMNVKENEKVLILTDEPTPDEWRMFSESRLIDMIQRVFLAKTVSDIGSELYGKDMDFLVFPSLGKSGTEPTQDISHKMLDYDVVIALTTFSLSHTEARAAVCNKGGRFASMPTFTADMFFEGGPMSVDYDAIARKSTELAEMATKAQKARVEGPEGTLIEMELGKEFEPDTGLYPDPGNWGNLPAGEAYGAPMEGTANGKIVVLKGWHPRLKEKMIITVKDGLVVNIEGGGSEGDRYRQLLYIGMKIPEDRKDLIMSRRNIAELGIGTNPNAKRPDIVLEAEKIEGSVHIGIGDNSHFPEGKISSDLHQDFVIPNAKLWFDDMKIIDSEKFKL
ncbi:MAG: aminopeptidase [Candidatus Hodarchaeota archaeon]